MAEFLADYLGAGWLRRAVPAHRREPGERRRPPARQRRRPGATALRADRRRLRRDGSGRRALAGADHPRRPAPAALRRGRERDRAGLREPEGLRDLRGGSRGGRAASGRTAARGRDRRARRGRHADEPAAGPGALQHGPGQRLLLHAGAGRARRFRHHRQAGLLGLLGRGRPILVQDPGEGHAELHRHSPRRALHEPDRRDDEGDRRSGGVVPAVQRPQHVGAGRTAGLDRRHRGRVGPTSRPSCRRPATSTWTCG